MHACRYTSESAYRAACSAYRANRRARWAASMAYEARPLNANEAVERAARDSELASLPVVPRPAGFDTPSFCAMGERRLHRARLVRELRECRAELARRADELCGIAARHNCTVADIPAYDRIHYARSMVAELRELGAARANFARALGRKTAGWCRYVTCERAPA